MELPQRPKRSRRTKNETSEEHPPATQQKALEFRPPPETRAGVAPAQLDETPTVAVPHGAKYEWGTSLEEAFENVALAMFNYMTPLTAIQETEGVARSIEAEGHDLHTLLFQYLDEFLFLFASEMFVPYQISIKQLDQSSWKVQATGNGTKFDRAKHAQGTEVKAITYSAMQVIQTDKQTDIYVIIDI